MRLCTSHIGRGFGIAILALETFAVALPARAEAFAPGIAALAVAVLVVVERALLAFALTPEQQAVTYDQGYFYPGPAVKNVALDQAPAASKTTIEKYGDTEFDGWISANPAKNSLPATAQVTAFDLWDKKIGSTK